jgi:hypothetical protein
MGPKSSFGGALATSLILAMSCTDVERAFAPQDAIGGAIGGESDSSGGVGSSPDPGHSGGVGEGGAAPGQAGTAVSGEADGGANDVGGGSMAGTAAAGEGGDPLAGGVCPSGQAVCESSCVDVLASDEHCGASCAKCSGALPRCSSGSCVACLAPADCPAPGSVCGANHECECRPQSVSNILVNPGFASALGLESWSPSRGATWSTDDADACSGSGSVRLQEVTSPIADLGSISQCVAASADTTYTFGFEVKPGSWSCQLTFYTGTSCDGTASSGSSIKQNHAYTGWGTSYGSRKAPVNTQSLELSCQTTGPGPDYIDQIYLNATGEGY